ncbi:MAG: hypothetical protein ACFFBP_10600 [Promethearchaeota archaeon]
MQIPPLTDKRWKELVVGNIDFEFEFLAIKILMFRIRLNIKKDNSPEIINKSAEEIRNLFLKTIKLPIAQSDLKKIFGGDVN